MIELKIIKMDETKNCCNNPNKKNSRRIKNKNFINFYKGNSLEIKIKQLKKINKIDKNYC